MPVTNFIWDRVSDNVRMEVDGTGAITAEYANEPGKFGELISQRRGSTNSFYHFDVHDSTRQLTNDAETVIDSYGYSAFGESVSSSGATPNPFRFYGGFGYYSNEETGEVYVRRRTYSPSDGRWLSTDPFDFIDGSNLYKAYFVPLGSDPSGTFSFCQTVVQDPIPTDVCGGAEAKMRWSIELDLNTEDPRFKFSVHGWVIQKAEAKYEYTDCTGEPEGPDDHCFYEGWQVRDGDVYVGDSKTKIYGVDVFNIKDRGQNTTGRITFSGSVTFLEGYELTYPPWGRAGQGNHPRVVDNLPWLWCDDGPPGQFENSITMDRTLVSEWTCCKCFQRDTDVSKSTGWRNT